MPHTLLRRKRRKRRDDKPTTVRAIAQARKGRSHNAALIVDYKRRIVEMENYFKKYPEDFGSSLMDNNTKIDMVNIDANHIIAFFETKEMQYLDGSWGLDDPQNAAKYRSALWYYRQELEIPDAKVTKYESILRKWQRSANKEIAQARQDGKLPARKGKAELPYVLFKKLAYLFMRWFLSQFHLFHLLMWTCAGRSANIGECSLNAFAIQDDALTMVMPVSKGDNLGLYDDDIHIYANPYDPALCVIFAFGAYLLTNTSIGVDNRLFTNGKKPQAYHLQTLKRSAEVQKLTQDTTGKSFSAYGNHSWRKGILTWILDVADGIIQRALDCRAGHYSGGSIKEAYYKFNASADAKIGRKLAHIIQETQDDGILPPHFKDVGDPYFSVSNLKSIFPFTKNLTDSEILSFKPVMLRTLASVVHHYDAVAKEYPSHSVLQSALADENVRLKLKSLMVDNFMDFNCTSLTRTGIDKKERRKEARMKKIEDAIDGRYNNGATATNNKMDLILKNQERILAMNFQRENEKDDGYIWQDGTKSLIPEDFEFPRCKLLGAWRMWTKGHKHCGSCYTKSVVPFKNLAPNMFKGLKTQRKTFSKWQCVMKFIESKLDEKLPSWPSEDEWKVQPYLTSITDEKLKKNGLSIKIEQYSVSYIYSLLHKK